MADAATKKVFISVDSEDSQQESIKTSRRKFGVIQKDATDKENLVGRQHALLNAKLQLESTPKQRKATLVHQHSQTVECGPSRVTEDDLTSLEEPSEKYWESLAETRRRALEDSLCENEALHNRVRSLESELDVTNEMLEHARSLVEVLKEMLEENEAEKEGAEGHEEEEADDKEEETVTNTPPSSAEKVDPVNEGEEGQEEGEEADQE